MIHQAVMLEPALAGLGLREDGCYIDATFGRGGHSAAILSRLGVNGRLFAIDQDPAAIEAAQQRFANEPRFTIGHGSFAMLMQFCRQWEIDGQVDGVLLDLGVSSPQLDDATRGFSFMHDGPLDMRMDYTQGVSAKEWLAAADEKEIADVLWRFGEERFSRRIARRIVELRQQQPIETTQQLVDVIIAACPRTEKHKHPATRSFQAIRIFINHELDALQTVLSQCVEVLKAGGRLVVISFHSLEDRLVKRFMREQVQGKPLPKGLPVMQSNAGCTLKLIGKAQKPAASETAQNPRARSAMLRIAEKL